MAGTFAARTKPARRLCQLAACAMALAPWPAAAAGSPSLLGMWQRADGKTRISVAPCGSQLCAVNVWVKNPGGSEKVGDKLVMTLQQTSPAVLSGRAFDTRRNRSYAVTVKLNGDAMTTRGCILFGVLCRTASWSRAN